MSTSRTLIDNWMLELAFSMWTDNYEKNFTDYEEEHTSMLAVYLGQPALYTYRHQAWTWKDSIVIDTATALLQTLDLLVINNELVYDTTFSNAWKRFSQSDLVKPMLREVKLSNKVTKELLPSIGFFPKYPDDNGMISEGAIYYLSLARFLGVYYWPSPKRAEYLKQNYFNKVNNFALSFRDFIDETSKQIAAEILEPIKIESQLFFSGFSVPILASCEKPSSILPTLIQVRNSSSGKGFREWLEKMDEVLQTGNLKFIAKEMKTVNDVISDIRKDLGIDTKGEQFAELQIGLSPSLNLGDEAIKTIISQFKPKPYHVIFIREYFDKFLESGNVKTHLSRLFPYIK